MSPAAASWHVGKGMLVPFLEIVVASSSIFTILAISIERLRVVCKPLSSTNDTLSHTFMAILFIWMLAIIISSPMFSIVVYKESVMKDGTQIKVCRIPITTSWRKCYVIANQVIVFVIPVVILLVLYTKVIRHLRKSSSNSIELSGYTCNQERYRIRRQVVNTILCIVFVFFLCYLPFRVISLVFIFGDQDILRKLGLERYLNLLYFSRCLLYANHALNPILYNFVSSKFRSAFKCLILERRCSGNEKRYKSPVGSMRKENQRLIFKRKEISENGEFTKSSRNENDSGLESEIQRRNELNESRELKARVPKIQQNEKSKLLVTEENQTCALSNEYINLDVQDKSSAKVRFIMTKEGYVIGITLRKIKNVQTL